MQGSIESWVSWLFLDSVWTAITYLMVWLAFLFIATIGQVRELQRRITGLEHDLYDGNEAHYIETGERLDYYLVPTLSEHQRFKDKEPGLVWSPREYPTRPN